MEIRKGEIKDLEVLVDFACSMALETEGKKLNSEIVGRGVRVLIENPIKGVYYVAEIDGKVVGCLMVNLQWVDWQEVYYYYIQSVYTDINYRGRGVFKALYHHVLNEASQKSASLRLYADADNIKAIEVYKRLGMSVTDYKFLDVDFAFS